MDAETLPYALDLVAGSGVILSPERRAALRTSLLLVRRDYRFEQVRLWGRILGVRGSYFIAEGLGPDRLGVRSRLYRRVGLTGGRCGGKGRSQQKTPPRPNTRALPPPSPAGLCTLNNCLPDRETLHRGPAPLT